MKKKLFSLTAVAMFASSLVNATTYEKPMEEEFNGTFCDKMALHIMDALENTYGCYDDAEEYNADFQELKKWCENGTAQ